MTLRRKGLAAAVCLGVLLAGAAVYGLRSKAAPGRSDIDTSAFVAYPGSTMIKDVFQKADHGRYIDTGSFSNPTQLIRRYRLSEPVPRAEFERWRDATYPLPGWQVTNRASPNETLYGRTVEKRQHVLEIAVITRGPADPLIPEYEITYAVR